MLVGSVTTPPPPAEPPSPPAAPPSPATPPPEAARAAVAKEAAERAVPVKEAVAMVGGLGGQLPSAPRCNRR